MFHLVILTSEKLVYDGQASSLIAPGALGYLEILTGHAPLITYLQPGKLIVTTDQGKTVYAVSDGFLDVNHNEVTLLTDGIELPEEIDIEKALAAKERALERVYSNDKSVDPDRAKDALLKAENRIKIYRTYVREHTPSASFREI